MKILVFDLETLYEYSLFGFYEPATREWYIFDIHRYANDLYSLVKFLEWVRKEGYYLVGYNSVNFDAQVLEFVLDHHQKWVDLTNLEITRKIWQFAQDVIDDQRHELFPPYREYQFTLRHIDLMRIHHLDNKHRRTSLKWLEFMMDMDTIEEMPLHHKAEGLTLEQITLIKNYWRVDIQATCKLLDYTLGEVEHEHYKGKNKIQDRLDIIEELKFPATCMNFSDVKIGDEINLRGYLTQTKYDIKKVQELRRMRKATKRFTFGDAIPDYVKFQTAEMRDFYNKVKKVKVLIEGDQEFQLTFRGTTYTVALGGIHSNEKNREIIPATDEILRDADVGSQYPNAIVKRRLFPRHLGEAWLVNYKGQILRRMQYKGKSKDNPKFKGLSDTFKLALNGGGFGKTNEKTNWQYGPEVTFYCTIGNQFEILMLIETLELAGIHCVSANTDGIVCLFKKNLEPVYNEICGEWEEKVGNTEMGKLEFSDFSKLFQESVNSYVAVKTDGTPKLKGRFAHEVELHKNNTKDVSRIERKALVEYITKGTDVATTIKGSTNIFDFCIGLKSGYDYHYETIDPKSSEATIYKKVIRFFISRDGKKLIKVKNEDSLATGADVTRIVDGSLVTMFNTRVDQPMQAYNIDYDYYIRGAQDIITRVQRGKKAVAINPNQTSMF
jgi:hypothetical protein